MNETTKIKEKALTIVEQAKAVTITNSETYLSAGQFWKTLGEMVKEVKDTFDPICEKAHAAHKEATAKRSKYLDPLTTAQKDVKQLMGAYEAAEERKRRAEEARLQEIARKAEEDRLLAEAVAAEDAGENEEAAAIIAEPVYVPPVVVPKATPKIQGVVYREVWGAELVDIKALCKAVAEGKASAECVLPNMPVLNKLAVALKSTMSIPGVKAASKRV